MARRRRTDKPPLERIAVPENDREEPRAPKVRHPETEASLVLVNGAMMPIICPHCGRGMQPRIRSSKGQYKYCNCSLCGKQMVYTPATVRAIDD